MFPHASRLQSEAKSFAQELSSLILRVSRFRAAYRPSCALAQKVRQASSRVQTKTRQAVHRRGGGLAGFSAY